MRLIKARVSNYRSVMDTGFFEIERLKTIFVGPNEAGKTAILQALQKLNPPQGIPPYEPLRDYPRSKYDEDIKKERISLAKVSFVEGHFCMEAQDKDQLPDGFKDVVYVYGRYLNNTAWHKIEGGLLEPTYNDIEKNILKLMPHINDNYIKKQLSINPDDLEVTPITDELKIILKPLNSSSTVITFDMSKKIMSWLNDNYQYIDETEDSRFDNIKDVLEIVATRAKALQVCSANLPQFVLFSNYFKIRPALHLEKLALRTENNTLDDTQYDYGNNCLLKLLGFSARELSSAGNTNEIDVNIPEQYKIYKDKLDERDYTLNAASVRLTQEIIRIWNPSTLKHEASKLEIKADGQYLKVVVEDELGVKVELDQRSEGFQWIVSFFVVFFAESDDKHKNAILLLDEPGMSLHGLKQAEFRETISRLSLMNQTIFTTHSPFLIGSDELDLVRVVEMPDRTQGTIVHTSLTASDSAAILPLQEALGYDLAQSLFMHKKNLVLEGLTDYWYIEAISGLLKEAKLEGLDDKIALIPASSASKVVYFATILHAHDLKVAALLDSDNEGDQVAKQDTLVNALKSKGIIRTKDVYKGEVVKSEIEDLFRETLVSIAKNDLLWDVANESVSQPTRPIVDVFSHVIKKDFSKFKLAKAFLRWSKENAFYSLSEEEQQHCISLIDRINKALK